ncbi:MAG: vitamin B12 dependent-methionine synthase activation domain-containing protein [Clostridium perfringens]|nr:vitamin B12 dependent-methionine synthase activation domain-containing protein [Clostridium perfringens]
MNKDDIKINSSEVLRYLGYKGQTLDERITNNIKKSKNLVKNAIDLRYIVKRYKIEEVTEGIALKETKFILKGEDIKKHLKSCKECVLMAVTLGNNFERLLRLYERKSLSESIIMDSCGTTAIEEACDLLELNIKEKMEKDNLFITSRYSPGYGDLPIEIQNDFISLLNCQKEIGLTCSENNILIPRKSVTAIIGISEENIKKQGKKCAVCLKNEDCLYRRKGESCGNITI